MYKKIAISLLLFLAQMAHSATIDVNSYSDIQTMSPNTNDIYNIANSFVTSGDIGSISNNVTTFTINGNGKTLNGANLYKGFNFKTSAPGNDVIGTGTFSVNNLNLNNFKSANVGGALYLSSQTWAIAPDGNWVTLPNNVYINNSDFTSNEARVYGGAIGISYTDPNNSGSYRPNKNPNILTSIQNSNFTSNSSSSQGGALFLNYSTADEVILDIKDTNFTSNTSKGGFGGGGLYAATAAYVNKFSGTLNNVKFINNSTIGSINGGGAMFSMANNYSPRDKTIRISNSLFDGNSSGAYGGGLYAGLFGADNLIDVTNTTFTNNQASYGAGMYLSAYKTSDYIFKISNSTFTENKAKSHGGAIYLLDDDATNTNSKFIVSNSSFTSNQAKYSNSSGNGGAIYLKTESNATPAYLSVSNSSFNSNSAKDGGAMYLLRYNDDEPIDTYTSIIDSSFAGNSATNRGGAIAIMDGSLNIVANAKDVVFSANTQAGNPNDIYLIQDYFSGAKLNLNAASGKKISLTGGIASNNSVNQVNINKNINYMDSAGNQVAAPVLGDIQFNNSVSDVVLNLYNGTLSIGQDETVNLTAPNPDGFIDNNTLNIYGGTLNLANNHVGAMSLNALNLNGNANLALDTNLALGTMDTISATSLSGSGTLNVNKFNVIADNPSATTINIYAQSPDIASNIEVSATKALGPIFKYNVAFDATSGDVVFSKNSTPEFNPCVLAAPIAAQAGGYVVQTQSFEKAFVNMDSMMLMAQKQRVALKNRNKYAILDDSGIKYDETNQKIWFKPFTSFETIGLDNGPEVGNITYGAIFGSDSEIIELPHGVDMVYSFYAGYSGSHQTYDTVGIYQNGGLLGASVAFYKGNFFTGLTANVGASAGNASTMFGNETFTMLLAGVASKTGYNFEFFDGKFIVQPNFLMSYSFVNTFDYTSANGASISQDPLHAIQIAPGVRLIGNLKGGLQPYITCQMVWNIMDKTKFYANDVMLPQMSIKPYIQYGVGVQKRFSDRFSIFTEAMIRNGGRNGIALQTGFVLELGKGKGEKL